MLKIGLTGGIGSGKTVVANIFRQLGVPVYEADAEARRLTESSGEIKSAIREYFGDGFFLKDGSLDRGKLAQLVFVDKEKLSRLNSFIHPVVKKHFSDWLQKQGSRQYIIKEAAILFESGTNLGLDKVISVVAPEEIRIGRVMQRDNSSEDKIRSVMKNQLSEEERRQRSDFVITNDDKILLIPQILELHKLFSAGKL